VTVRKSRPSTVKTPKAVKVSYKQNITDHWNFLHDQVTVFVDSGGKLHYRGGKNVGEEADKMMTQLRDAIETANTDDPDQTHPLTSLIAELDNDGVARSRFFIDLCNIHKQQSAKEDDVVMDDETAGRTRKPRSRKASKSSAAAIASEFMP